MHHDLLNGFEGVYFSGECLDQGPASHGPVMGLRLPMPPFTSTTTTMKTQPVAAYSQREYHNRLAC